MKIKLIIMKKNINVNDNNDFINRLNRNNNLNNNNKCYPNNNFKE